jgi:hypothetical protein
MAVEARRGCGYRKVGGLYVVAEGAWASCERLPIPLGLCLHCGQGIKQTRGWTWMPVEGLLDRAQPCQTQDAHCPACALCRSFKGVPLAPEGKVGLLWVGKQFYGTPDDWATEALRQGVSRRISAIPKGLVVGKTVVAVAHPDGVRPGEPGVFQIFKPTRLELIVTPSMREEDWVKQYQKQGVTLVEVPENDADHAPVKRNVKSRRQQAADRYAREPKKIVGHPDQMPLFKQ